MLVYPVLVLPCAADDADADGNRSNGRLEEMEWNAWAIGSGEWGPEFQGTSPLRNTTGKGGGLKVQLERAGRGVNAWGASDGRMVSLSPATCGSPNAGLENTRP